jgi:hypothetical protein
MHTFASSPNEPILKENNLGTPEHHEVVPVFK